MVRRLDLSDRDLKEKSETAREKLDKLRLRSESVLNDLKASLDVESNEISIELKKFLKSDYCKRQITSGWTCGELPVVSSGNWSWIRTRIHEAFYDRLVECIEHWDREERRIEGVEEHLSCQIKFELQLLEEELNDIEKEIQCDTSSTSSDDMSDLSKTRRKSFQKSKILPPEPKMPMKLAGRVIKPLRLIMSPIRSRMMMNEYRTNPVRVAERTALKMYDGLMTSSVRSEAGLAHLADYLLERPREYLEAVERRIPDMITANRVLLNHLEQSIEAERKHQSEYEEMMSSTEELKRALMEYGEGYIFVADFSRGELQIQQKPTDGGDAVSVAFNVTDFIRKSSGDLDVCRRRDIRGLWTVTYSGCLSRSGVERPVAIKVYLPSSGVEFTYKEVAKLRLRLK